jgi:putative redox protein
MSGTQIAAAFLESGEPIHRQSIRVGHHTIVADEPPSNGGADAGPSPFSLLLASVAACTSITLRMYADRKGWALGTVKVDVRIFRDGDAVRIDRVVRLSGQVTGEQKQRLAEIADKTPVTKVLLKGVTIATTFDP